MRVFIFSTTDVELYSMLGHTKDTNIGKENWYTVFVFVVSQLSWQPRRESQDGWAQNQINVSEWNNMSTCRLLFQSTSTIKKIQFKLLV